MNLHSILSKRTAINRVSQLIDYVIDNEDNFNELIDLYLSGSYVVTHYAAHVIEGCLVQKPLILKPYIKRLIISAQRPEAHNSEKRNTIRLLQFIDVPKSAQGNVIDMCFRFLTDRKEPIAVRVFSMTVIYNNSLNSPELRRELQLIIEDELPYGSPAFVSRARKIQKKLK